MAKSKSSFSFSSRLGTIEGTLIHTVIYLPEDIVKELPEGRVRAKGTINGIPFALAPQYVKDGSRYFAVGAPLRKAIKIREGDPVKVIFKLVDPNIVDVPEELEAVLAQDDKAMKVWEGLTPGYQRSLIHYITSVKNVDSRIKRSLELMEKAKAGQLSTQKDIKPNKKRSDD
jgi:hypothetical protein